MGSTMGHRACGRQTLLMVLALLMLLSCSAMPPASAGGSTYYVATNGNDSNPGTISQPWRTIQKAASTLVAGDTAYVRAGTYNERVTPQRSGSAENPIAYRAYPGETVTIDGKDSLSDAFYLSGLSYLIIDGFIMSNWDLFGMRVLNSHHIEIANNEIKSPNATYSGIWGDHSQYCNIHHNKVHDCPENGIAMSHESDYNQIHGNFVYNNGFKQQQYWAGIALEVNSNYNQIFNNLVYNNKHAGLLTNSQYNYWYHNTVYSNPNTSGGGGGIYLCNWEDSTMDQNTFRDNIIVATGSNEYTVYIQEAVGRNNSFDSNIHWHTSREARVHWGDESLTFSRWRSTYGQETNGFSLNPLFAGGIPTDPSYYRLQSSSPAIDAGVNVGITADYDGTPRPQGGGFDIGAFEQMRTPAPTPTHTLPLTQSVGYLPAITVL